ncbi:MAG: hypothetical protein RLZZ129_1341 [Verrucomicrobiota bacterium]
MAYPPYYDRLHNFADEQAAHPSDPLPADWLEEELNAVKTSVDSTIDGLKRVQRSDGGLANRTVGYDQLKPELRVGFREPRAWAAGTVYGVNDTVAYDTSFFACVVAHTASPAFETDLGNGKWLEILDLSPLTGDAETARDAAIAAQGAAEEAQAAAESAASSASISQSAAASSASAASGSASAASASASAAGSAQTGAEAAQIAAEAAQAAAEAAFTGDVEDVADALAAAGFVGDMLKATYDANDDGVVDYITNALAQAGGGEGGQINLEKASDSTLSGNVALDTAAQNFRVFEQGGTSRGAYIDLTECGAGASSKLLHEGNTTTAGRTLLTAADAAAQRTALGLATLAQKATIDSAALVDNSILTFAKLASAAISDQSTAEAGTATDKLMTPQRTAQAIVAKSPATLAATGAQALPSGLLLKWGMVGAGASSGTVTFDAAFPNACLGVHLQVIGTGAPMAFAAHLASSPLAASFNWYLRQTAATGVTGASTAVGFMWLAFGH